MHVEKLGGGSGDLPLEILIQTSKKNDAQTNTGHSMTIPSDAKYVILFDNYGAEKIRINGHRITDADFESYYKYETAFATTSRVHGTALLVYDVGANSLIQWDGAYSLNAFGFALGEKN